MQSTQGSKKKAPQINRDRIVDIPISKIYDFLMKKRLVQDRQGATRLIQQQIGMNNLSNAGKMTCDEFNKLFCKGMFKFCLINILNSLQEEGKPQVGASPVRSNSKLLDQDMHAVTSSNTGALANTSLPSVEIEEAEHMSEV